MGCAQQFLGIGTAPVVFEPAAETVRIGFERTGFSADLALTLFALALPMDGCDFFSHEGTFLG